MSVYYFYQKYCNNLSSQLREALEEITDGTDEFTSCVQVHPLDEHIEVHAPDERTVRLALLRLKDKIQATRVHVGACATLAP